MTPYVFYVFIDEPRSHYKFLTLIISVYLDDQTIKTSQMITNHLQTVKATQTQ